MATPTYLNSSPVETEVEELLNPRIDPGTGGFLDLFYEDIPGLEPYPELTREEYQRLNQYLTIAEEFSLMERPEFYAASQAAESIAVKERLGLERQIASNEALCDGIKHATTLLEVEEWQQESVTLEDLLAVKAGELDTAYRSRVETPVEAEPMPQFPFEEMDLPTQYASEGRAEETLEIIVGTAKDLAIGGLVLGAYGLMRAWEVAGDVKDALVEGGKRFGARIVEVLQTEIPLPSLSLNSPAVRYSAACAGGLAVVAGSAGLLYALSRDAPAIAYELEKAGIEEKVPQDLLASLRLTPIPSLEAEAAEDCTPEEPEIELSPEDLAPDEPEYQTAKIDAPAAPILIPTRAPQPTPQPEYIATVPVPTTYTTTTIAGCEPVRPCVKQGRREMTFDLQIGKKRTEACYWVNSKRGMRRLTSEERPRQHKGPDLIGSNGEALEMGEPIYFAGFVPGELAVVTNVSFPGNDTLIEYQSSLGDWVITRKIRHQDPKVREGDVLKNDTLIATVAMHGNSTGPHVHYEVEITTTDNNSTHTTDLRTLGNVVINPYLASLEQREATTTLASIAGPSTTTLSSLLDESFLTGTQ